MFIQCLCIRSCSMQAGGNTNCYYLCLNHKNYLVYSFLIGFPKPWVSSFFSHICKVFRRAFCIPLGLSLCSWLLPYKFTYLALPEHWCLLIHWELWALNGFHFPEPWLGICFQILNWSNYKAHLICFLLSGMTVICCHCPVLKGICFVYIAQFLVKKKSKCWPCCSIIFESISSINFLML